MNNILSIKQDRDWNRIFNILLICFAFSIPLSKAALVFFAILLIIVWLIEKDYDAKIKKIKDSFFIKMLFSFLLISFISILWSDHFLFALGYFKKYWFFLLIPFIYTSLKKESIKYIINAFLIGVFISQLASFGLFFELISYKNIPSHDPTPFMDHTNFSIYLAFSAFISLHLFLSKKEQLYKVIYLNYFLITLICLFINSGRTGQVAFFIALVFFLFVKIKNKFLALITMFGLIFSIVTLGYNYSPVFKHRLDESVTDINQLLVKNDFSGGISIRGALWVVGANTSLHEPILGTGFGDEGKNIDKELKEKHFYNFINNKNDYIDFHNSFVQTLVQLGFVGFIIHIFIFISLLKLKFEDKNLRDLNLVFLILFILLSMGGNSLHILASMALFTLFAPIFAVLSEKEKEGLLK